MEANPIASAAAEILRAAYAEYRSRFDAITDRAEMRFRGGDWAGAHQDAAERLDLYKSAVDRTVAELLGLPSGTLRERGPWPETKRLYSLSAAGREDAEIARTFYNSVSRRILTTVGVDSAVDYTPEDFAAETPRPGAPVHRSFAPRKDLQETVREILSHSAFAGGYQNLERDSALCARRLEASLKIGFGGAAPGAVDVLTPVFYRSNGAFLVGRLRRGEQILPLVFALLRAQDGVVVDALLTHPDDASIVFSFTRSYFHVRADRPAQIVSFLKSIMPHKPVSELYSAIGFNKHGKTELYSDLYRHLAASRDLFETARGEKGMVMTVFALPSYDVVFKIIKDRFSYTKTGDRRKVMDRYDLVFRHDRAGRLVDAQEFEHLQFEKNRFSEPLLRELLETAAGSVRVEGERVIIEHLYTERRLTPLDIYLREENEDEAREALLDFGAALKDLAAANIFPGDILLKNFGVTRHRRVVFYDYDEISLLTECVFRSIPTARDPEDDLAAEPWYYVREGEVFPEEFKTFLALPDRFKDLFVRRHGEIFTVEFWKTLQDKHRAGLFIDIFPYKESLRFPRPS